MAKSVLKWAVVSALFIASAASLQAQADLIRVLGSAGYTTLKLENDTGAKKPAGVDFKVAAQFDVVSPVPGLSVFVGPELISGTFVREEAVQGVIKETRKSTALGLDSGLHFGMIPLVTLQLGYSYLFPLSGSLEEEKVGSKTEYKLKSGSESAVMARALLTLAPMLRAGVEYSLGEGKTKYENREKEDSFDSTSLRAVLAIAL